MKRFNLFNMTAISLLITFTMGAIDAYSFTIHNGIFISAQTGNMIVFAILFFKEGIAAASPRIYIFLGFLLGAIIGQFIKNRFEHSSIKLQINLFITCLWLLFFAIIQERLSETNLMIIMAVFASIQLTLFSTIFGTPVNNGIMTGNIKNMGNNLFNFITTKNIQALKTALHFFYGLVTFVFGVFFGVSIMQHDKELVLWYCFDIISIFWLLGYLINKIKQPLLK